MVRIAKFWLESAPMRRRMRGLFQIKNGEMKIRFVQRMTMKARWKMKLFSMALATAVAALASAADYVVTVAANTTNIIDAAFVAELGSADRLVKRGIGVLKSSAAMASYTGEIVVEEGVLLVTETGAVGNKDVSGNVTVSNGATVIFAPLVNNGIKCGKRTVQIAGNGAEGQLGALVFEGGSLQQEGCLRYITLLEDARIRSTSEFTLYNGTLDMNGNTLTLSVRNKSSSGSTSWEYGFTMLRSTIRNPGNLILETGKLVISGSPYETYVPDWKGSGDDNTLTVKTGTKLQFTSTVTKLPWKLEVESSAGLMASTDIFSTSPYNNAWSGPIELKGLTSISYNNARVGSINFLGAVSGVGGMSWSGYTTLHLWNTNTYSGSTSVTAIDSNPTPLHLHCGRALPFNSNTINLTDCNLPMHGEDFYELPVIKMKNNGNRKITGAISGGNMAGLIKTGLGILQYDSMVAVTGRTEVLEGTLQLCVHSPRRQIGGIKQGECSFESDSYSSPGANYYWSNYSKTYPAVAHTLDSIHYAYTSVQPLWAKQHAMSRYEGYIWNDSPTNETWTFMSGCQNRARMWINDTRIFDQNSYQIATFGRAVLKPGANPFVYCIYFAATETGGGGGAKKNLTDIRDFDGVYTEKDVRLKWGNLKGCAFNRFGIESYNEADYEKFENLLDGSLITVTDDLSGLAPRLAGAFTNMYVAASAIFNIGERNMSIVIPEFSGEGTVMNGILEIGKKLVVRADMAEPLKFADAELCFAENAVVSADDETALSRERVFGNPYVIAVTDGAFTQTPATDPELAESRWKVELSKDSRSMLMYYVPRGLSVVVR